jgi:hypothetical protein
MRIAQLFDHLDENGDWAFASDRPRISDPEERARLAKFLRGGRTINHVPGFDDDVIDPTREPGPQLSTFTDGTWIWSAQLTYYLITYGIAPEPDFLAHIRECGYEAEEPDMAVQMEALKILRRR